jgi:DNA-binding NarL/FixJ family response regulator
VEGEATLGKRTGPARLLLADDHDLVRGGFNRMLDREADLEVVGEAANGREAVELCRSLRPDLVLMDVRMPEMDGLEATRTIKAAQPGVSVLVVTTYENPDYLLEALKAGAAGYLLKDVPKKQLLNAVRRVLNGESPLNQELAAQLIQRLVSEAAQPLQQPTQPRDRRGPRHQRGHGQGPRAEPDQEAGGLGPHPGRRPGRRAEDAHHLRPASRPTDETRLSAKRPQKYSTRHIPKIPPGPHNHREGYRQAVRPWASDHEGAARRRSPR